MPSQPLVGRKRQMFELPMLTATSNCRRRVNSTQQAHQRQSKSKEQFLGENGDWECDSQNGKDKRGTVIIKSPTKVSDPAVLERMRQFCAIQIKASCLPNSKRIPLETKVGKANQVTQVQTCELAKVAAVITTPRLTVRQLTSSRPPLSRRVMGLNRAKSGVGIVRCRSSNLDGDDTETEEENDGPEIIV